MVFLNDWTLESEFGWERQLCNFGLISNTDSKWDKEKKFQIIYTLQNT